MEDSTPSAEKASPYGAPEVHRVLSLVLVAAAFVLVLISLIVPWWEIYWVRTGLPNSREGWLFGVNFFCWDAPGGTTTSCNFFPAAIPGSAPYPGTLAIAYELAVASLVFLLFATLLQLLGRERSTFGLAGVVLGFLAGALALLAAVYAWAALPSEMASVFSVVDGFFGAASEPDVGQGTRDYTWGGSFGWFFAVFGGISSLAAACLWFRSIRLRRRSGAG